MADEATNLKPSPLSVLPPEDAVERRLGVSLEMFPTLRAALEEHGEVFRGELMEFAHALHYKRAPRVRRSLVAHVFTGGDVPEVAVVRDISETGVRLWVDGDQAFDAGHQNLYRIEVKVPGSRRYISMRAQLVRVAENQRERGVELAFRFTSPLEAQAMEHFISRVRGE